MYKTKTHTVRIPYQMVSKRFDNGALSGSEYGPVRLITAPWSRTTKSQVPGWRKRIMNGENATTYLSGSEVRVRYSPGYISRLTFNGFGCVQLTQFVVEGMLSSVPIWIDPASLSGWADVVTRVENKAKTAYVSKAIQKQVKLQGLTVVGELRDTLRFLKRPGRALRERIDQYARDARRNYRRSRGSPPKVRKRTLRDTWLEGQFAVRPLVSDISDAMTAIGHLNDELVGESINSGWIREVLPVNESIMNNSNAVSPLGLKWEYTETRYCTRFVRYMGRVSVPADATGRRLALRTFGFSWDQFIPTVWELIPYSFLVDYFTNIGDVIQSMSFCSADLKWTARSQRDLCSGQVGSFYMKPKTTSLTCKTVSEVLTPPTYSFESKAVHRDTYLGSLVPRFEFQIPGYGVKWLNIAALARLSRV